MNHFHGSWNPDDLQGVIYDRKLYFRLLRYLKPYLWLVGLSFVILLVLTLAEIIQPLITRSAIDDYIVSDKALAAFRNNADLAAFEEKTHHLKLKKYTVNDVHYYILPTKSRSRIDTPFLKQLNTTGQISAENFYFIKDTPKNREVLSEYLPNTDMALTNSEQFTGWFRVSDSEFAVSQNQIRKIPPLLRQSIRTDALSRLLLLSIFFFGLVTIRFVSGFLQTYLTNYYSQLAMKDLRHDIFAHMQKMPVSFFDKNPVGRLVTRVTSDVRAIDEMLSAGVITIIQDFILIVAIVILMLLLNWKLALVSFTVLPFVLYIIRVFRQKTRVVYREVRKQLAALNSALAEHLAGVKIIQLFNQYLRKRDEFDHINQENYKVSVAQLKLYAFFRPIINVSSQVAIALLIWWGGSQILRDMISIGLLMAFTTYVNKLFEPINDFSERFNILQSALAGAERIFDLMDKEPDDYRLDRKKELKLRGDISFDFVWMAYNTGEWVLRDVSFKVSPGEKIALVGHTGSGKTSIVNLIMGMHPYQRGMILLDGKAHHHYALDDIRHNIGIVQQDVFIFSGTIRDNIALNNRNLSAEELVQVSKYVNADHFIQKLPYKYEEPVMERGATLSTGQRQLLAFARVLAYNPSIFILDEATSNIDTETEILIQDALRKVMHNRTSIIIAHRLSTIQHVDRIIVLHKGEIVEQGNHFDLLEQKGIYYDLYRLQYT